MLPAILVQEYLHWLPRYFHAQFKVMVLTYEAMHDLGPICKEAPLSA